MNCDFCSSPNPTWCYPARDFTMESAPIVGSEGAWAACDECAALIEQKDRAGLIERVVKYFPFAGIPTATVREAARQIHRQFFESRTSGVERIRIGGV